MVFELMHKAIFFLVMIATVTVKSQEASDVSEPDVAQQAENEQITEEAAEGAPDIIESTEEISEDYSIEFPVDI